MHGINVLFLFSFFLFLITCYLCLLRLGVCQDYAFMGNLSKLLLFESSSIENDVISLDDYISRCTPEQKHIYYLVAPNREAALNSPYYETFKKHKIEVLFLYNTIDDFVMNNIKEYGGKEQCFVFYFVFCFLFC